MSFKSGESGEEPGTHGGAPLNSLALSISTAVHPFMRPLEWRNYVFLIPKEAVTDVTSLINVIKHLTRANSREICFMVAGMVHPIMQWRNKTVAR